ncbi:MAG TPA: hypothetical protein C5S37_07525 [Methanophagales archaeon]|nr:hypothetical protein [Methanophagales archaeon]
MERKKIEKEVKMEIKLCKELGTNGKKAYEGRYSWETMEQRLLALYHDLTGEVGEGSERK